MFIQSGKQSFHIPVLPILHNHSYEGYEEGAFHRLATILYVLPLGNGEINLCRISVESNPDGDETPPPRETRGGLSSH